jgi:hypothetical protein
MYFLMDGIFHILPDRQDQVGPRVEEQSLNAISPDVAFELLAAIKFKYQWSGILRSQFCQIVFLYNP